MTAPAIPSAGLQIDWVLVRELRFEDVPNPPDMIGQGLPAPLQADLQVRGLVNDEKTGCRVYLRIAFGEQDTTGALPKVVAAVEGQFRVVGAPASVDLKEFAEVQGPAILYPFLRDAVATATGKTRLGQILLAPINLMAARRPTPAGVPAQSEAQK